MSLVGYLKINIFLLQNAQSSLGVQPAPIQGSILPGVNKWCVKLTTHLHLMPKLRMSGITSPLPPMPSKRPQAKNLSYGNSQGFWWWYITFTITGVYGSTRHFGNLQVRGWHVKVLPVHAVKVYGGVRVTAPLTLNLGARWKWVVNFTPQQLYPREGTPLSIE